MPKKFYANAPPPRPLSPPLPTIFDSVDGGPAPSRPIFPPVSHKTGAVDNSFPPSPEPYDDDPRMPRPRFVDLDRPEHGERSSHLGAKPTTKRHWRRPSAKKKKEEDKRHEYSQQTEIDGIRIERKNGEKGYSVTRRRHRILKVEEEGHAPKREKANSSGSSFNDLLMASVNRPKGRR